MRQVVAALVLLIFVSAGCLQGDDVPNPAQNAPKTVQVTSSAFSNNTTIPTTFTCNAADASPPLVFGNVPAGAQTIALIMDDPDAPSGTWTHWTMWNLPKNRTSLPQGANVSAYGAREGTTSNGDAGYHGPCPPSGTHRYFFKVYALDASLNLTAGASLSSLLSAMQGHVLAWGELMGTYTKSG